VFQKIYTYLIEFLIRFLLKIQLKGVPFFQTLYNYCIIIVIDQIWLIYMNLIAM